METICMKCQNLLSEKNKNNVINLSSAELAHRVVTFKDEIPWRFDYSAYFNVRNKFPTKCSACRKKNSADDILKYFSYISQK